MAVASIIVLPGSPEVAESIEINIQGGPVDAQYELDVDDVLIESLQADNAGSLVASVSAAGHEAALANFGTWACEHPGELDHTSLKLIEPLHTVVLRLL